MHMKAGQDVVGARRVGHRPAASWLAGIEVQALTECEVVARVASARTAGVGGSILTANVDILHYIARDPSARTLAGASEIIVADGMPLVWASALRGSKVPERVTGASLFWTLSEAAAAQGASVFVLGGPPGAADQAAAALVTRNPGLRIAGTACPPIGFDTSEHGMDSLIEQIVASRPGLVLVGLGFPKQERVIAELRRHLPTAWYLGCGAAVVFAAGRTARAPRWMQRSGLEWLHRLAHDPRRLASRYIRDDITFAVTLLFSAAASRLRVMRQAAEVRGPRTPAGGAPAL